MNKEIFLQINSEIFQDGEEDKIEFFTEGKYYEKNNKKYFSYKEGKLTGMEGSTTIIIVDENKLTINRNGSNKSKMVFVLNKKTYTKYKTPYGIFEMEIITNSLILDLENKYIEVEYDLIVKGLSKGNNKIMIKIK
jgi:uncharacterized beta-barrel protein YwiB (DUF1934 family)